MLLLFIVYHYYIRFDRGEVHVVVVYCLPLLFKVFRVGRFIFLLLYCLPLLFKVSRRGGSCCGCYIVYHYCLKFDRGVVHVVVVIFSTNTL